MVRAITLATSVATCLTMGNGFVIRVPKSTPVETVPTKQASRIVETPMHVGGLGNGQMLSRSGSKANMRLPWMPSVFDHSAFGRRGACPLYAIAEIDPDFDDDGDDAARNGKGMGGTAGKGEEGDDDDSFNVDEVIEYQVKVTVEELGPHGSGVSSEETGSKVVATTVHAWYPTHGEGAGKWTEESHDGAGSLRGISVDHLPVQFEMIAEAIIELQNGELSRQDFLAAVDVECHETSSRAFVGQRPVEVTSGIKLTSTPVISNNTKSSDSVLKAHGHVPRYVGEQFPDKESDEDILKRLAGSQKMGIGDKYTAAVKGSSQNGAVPVVGDAGKGGKKWATKLWRHLRPKRRWAIVAIIIARSMLDAAGCIR